jgi:predicted DNA-binding transcriptional regulator YafY
VAVRECRFSSNQGIKLSKRGAIFYLVATAFNYDDIRLYAVHRMKNIEIKEANSRTLKNFNIDEYLEDGFLEFSEGKSISIILKVDENLAMILSETPLSTNQKVTKQSDYEYLIESTVIDSWQLYWWILSKGKAIEVISPDFLRKKIGDELLEASIKYCN